ncbi:PIR Superfamily Protein [Plasmodium ovale curtisi]|uniref:PIR Superfamily Protein n=1 Tax=Plasmodium ovale curtisi TaxID=864141 RepID=A0A1A8WSU7_PLAOA|nr:PIR Superfamily Protein [Plasmodium ovale curtisi]SBT01353.1 PIR Superfamily Protein [Plasmodium ovale curtisi]
MSSDNEKFYYDDFKIKYKFLENLNFGRIHTEFSNEPTLEGNVQKYCEDIKRDLPSNTFNETFQKCSCNNIYNIINILKGWDNVTLDGIPKDSKMYCIHFKYWIYEYIEKHIPQLSNYSLFGNIKDSLEKKLNCEGLFPCTFHEMTLDDIIKLRRILVFMLIYYSNIHNFHNQFIDCKYINYMGRGLKEYYESLKKCSTEKEQSNYCKEFNEFKKLYKEDYMYWKTSTADKDYTYSEEHTVKCALEIESLKEPLHFSYWNKKEILHLSNYPFDSQKSTIISASSAIGATAGISLFLLYLYKYTNIGSLIGLVIQRNNTKFLNMDTESHNLTQPISEFENANFESSNYNVSYYLLNNS